MKIGIIGGGAAGMMVAASLLELSDKPNVEVVLYERNFKLGQKVMISGGGRCNVTTGIEGVREILRNYPRGAKFMRTSMYDFQPNDLIEWIEQRGVPLKCESDLRVFPQSDNGVDIVSMFERLLDDKRCKVRYRSIVTNVSKTGDGFLVELKDGSKQEFDKLVISCGGRAYRHTGSVGDGYVFAEDLGHTVTEVAESLNSYMVSEQWVRDLAGLSFKEIGLRFEGDETHMFRGPIIFTHKGFSGPATFALSSLAAFEKMSEENPGKIYMDFLPDLNQEQVRDRLIRFKEENGKKNVSSFLKQFLPKRLVDSFEKSSMNLAEISKKDMNRIVEFLKRFETNVVKKTPGDEFVTAGGVSLDEIDSKTLESLICPGLYFAGEVLDIDGFTGGFNLQAAWCTGRKVGESLSLKSDL